MKECYKHFYKMQVLKGICEKCEIKNKCILLSLDFKQCKWRCPICKEQCGGIENHKGLHQCKTHSNIIIRSF